MLPCVSSRLAKRPATTNWSLTPIPGLRVKPAITETSRSTRARAQRRLAAVARTRGATAAPPRHRRDPPADSRALRAPAPTRAVRTARHTGLPVPGVGFANVNSFQSPFTAVSWTITWVTVLLERPGGHDVRQISSRKCCWYPQFAAGCVVTHRLTEGLRRRAPCRQ